MGGGVLEILVEVNRHFGGGCGVGPVCVRCSIINGIINHSVSIFSIIQI